MLISPAHQVNYDLSVCVCVCVYNFYIFYYIFSYMYVYINIYIHFIYIIYHVFKFIMTTWAEFTCVILSRWGDYFNKVG